MMNIAAPTRLSRQDPCRGTTIDMELSESGCRELRRTASESSRDDDDVGEACRAGAQRHHTGAMTSRHEGCLRIRTVFAGPPRPHRHVGGIVLDRGIWIRVIHDYDLRSTEHGDAFTGCSLARAP